MRELYQQQESFKLSPNSIFPITDFFLDLVDSNLPTVMSFVEYSNLLYQISEEIDWETKLGRLMFIINRSLPDDYRDDITDVISLLTKMEEKNLLGIDRLGVLKDLLKGIENAILNGKWKNSKSRERTTNSY